MSGSAPQFPDPLGAREVYRPGAVAHKAGLDTVRRVAALEQGALGAPGPGVSDGSLPSADADSHGNVAWTGPRLHLIHTIVKRNTFAGITGATNFFQTPAGSGPKFAATAGSTEAVFYVDPDDVPKAGSLDFKVFLRAWAITETNPTDSTLTVALNQVTAIGAGGTISTIGADVVSCTMTPNLATTAYAGESSTAVVSSAGFYVVRFSHSVDPAQSMTYGYGVYGLCS